MSLSVIRKDDIENNAPWSTIDTLNEFWHADERTTYELVHRHAGYADQPGEFTRWIPESWGVRWRVGLTYSQFWYADRKEAEERFKQIKAQA